MPPLQTVHLRVNDIVTGKPTPCRLRVTDGQGNYYAPFGNLACFATERNVDVGGNVRVGAKSYAYINGACEIDVPPGRLRVEVHKGPEYRPLNEEIDLPAGKLALRLEIERWIDLPSKGWYSGDTRVHFVSPHAALLEAQAEDVHVVNLLATETEVTDNDVPCPAISNIYAFSGQQPALEAPAYLVAVNTFNTHPELGSLSLLHCHRPVYPLSFGGPDGRDDWTLADWCDQCHRKKGLVVWSRAGHGSEDFLYGEPLADLILGKVDAFEIVGQVRSPYDLLPVYHKLLNAGFRVPLVGASGKESNHHVVGSVRTFAYLPSGQELTNQNWIEAVRAGRTLVSNGPFLSLTADGKGPGEMLELEGIGAKVTVKVTYPYRGTCSTLEVLFNEDIVWKKDFDYGEDEEFEIEWTCEQGGWLFARCMEDSQENRSGHDQPFAISSPIYIRIQGQPLDKKLWEIESLEVELRRLEEWARTRARCDPQQREKLIGIFAAARNRLQIGGH